MKIYKAKSKSDQQMDELDKYFFFFFFFYYIYDML